MQLYTHIEIDALKPCKPASNWIDTSWSGSLLDIMHLPQVLNVDKIWVFSKLGTDRDRRLFAVWCARQALALQSNPDPRSVAAVDTAEKYALGNATSDELAAAESAAWSAWIVAWSAESAESSSSAWNAAETSQVAYIVKMLKANPQ